MKKFLITLLFFCIVAVTGFSQNFPPGTTTRTSVTYISDASINGGQDTVFIQLSFLDGNKFVDCNGLKLRVVSKDFARKDIESIPGTGIFQFWSPPVAEKTVVIYQLTRFEIPVKSGSFYINPRKQVRLRLPF